jgi:hypothetical protein
MNNQLLANSLDVSSAISTLQTVKRMKFFIFYYEHSIFFNVRQINNS